MHACMHIHVCNYSYIHSHSCSLIGRSSHTGRVTNGRAIIHSFGQIVSLRSMHVSESMEISSLPMHGVNVIKHRKGLNSSSHSIDGPIISKPLKNIATSVSLRCWSTVAGITIGEEAVFPVKQARESSNSFLQTSPV